MKRILLVLGCISTLLLGTSWLENHSDSAVYKNLIPADSLRKMYEQPVSAWPKPHIDEGVEWEELGSLPPDNSHLEWDRNDTVKLGRLLFFDPRLSRSNQISCSSCHDPDRAWQDGRKISLGNDHLQGSRNTPSILNVHIQKELFWDGRSGSLEHQAIHPLAEHHEMDMEIKKLPRKLQKIKGYRENFKSVFNTKKITIEQIATAIASFEKTIKSRKTKFDRFLEGDHRALNDRELNGLHLFRTKARCMNCHSGTYFTDLDYHNIGLTYYGRKYEDLGRYAVTGMAEDVGKFKTPSLRGAMRTQPWMHNGLFDNMEGIINLYNSGMHQLDGKVDKSVDSLYPSTDKLLQPLHLTQQEKADLVLFIEALSGVEYKMPRPKLPE